MPHSRGPADDSLPTQLLPSPLPMIRCPHSFEAKHAGDSGHELLPAGRADLLLFAKGPVRPTAFYRLCLHCLRG